MMADRLRLVPITLKAANAFVIEHHRHHTKVVGHRGSVAAEMAGDIVGVAIVGRPVARGADNGRTAEVTRVCVDGTRHAASFLLAAARRLAFAMGYDRVITYTLATESGSSLRGAGFVPAAEVKGRSWSCESRPRTDKHPTVDKVRWESSRAPDAETAEGDG